MVRKNIEKYNIIKMKQKDGTKIVRANSNMYQH